MCEQMHTLYEVEELYKQCFINDIYVLREAFYVLPGQLAIVTQRT